LLANVVRRRSILDPSGKMRKKPHLPRKKRAEMLVRPGPVPDTLPPDPAERDRLLRARWDPWREWLKSMGASRGFRPLEDEPVPLFMEALRTAVRKPDNQDPTKISVKCFNAGLFDGVLVCTDPDRLRDAVIEGLGNAKAFGFGLLSLLPLQ
jgi:CRISPR system Cascade subunit CasE